VSERTRILHGTPWRGVFYLTGGGSLLLAELLTTPGASQTVLEAQVPYAEAALTGLLGRRPDQACSAPTARALAMAAFERARALAASAAEPPVTERLFGFACTASLATGRTKRGQHRAHVAIQTHATTYAAHVTFDADRPTEERELAEFMWHTLAATLEVPLATKLLVRPEVTRTDAEPDWRALVLGERDAITTVPHDGRLLMPGAFNPLHRAHEDMLAIAEARTGLAGAFELSIRNVDKPTLDYTEIARRLQQFTRPVWLTRLPTFVEKARQFPGCCFVVGADTLQRIVEPRYYASSAACDSALEELNELGTRFVAFGRTIEGRFRTLDDLDLPASIRAISIGISAAEFSDPLSSTDLRRKR
jgi:nicotinamide mononucleotide (NMN) deamidase PncC